MTRFLHIHNQFYLYSQTFKSLVLTLVLVCGKYKGIEKYHTDASVKLSNMLEHEYHIVIFYLF